MTTFTQRLTNLELSRTERIQYGLIGLWILAMISLPILKWTQGEQIIPTAVTGALLVQFSAVFYVVQTRLGLKQTSVMLGIVAVATWGIEFIGSSTDFPFGAYDYTDVLQPQLGHVPLLIPAAWFMMLPSAWAVAQLTVGRSRFWPYVGMSAVAITAWDLFLDPQMVDWGFWVWADSEGGYFGIPWTNYAGWLLTGVVVTLLVRPQRFDLPTIPLLIVYGIVWFLQTFGQAFFWGQVGPAIVGGVVMGGLLVWAAAKLLKTTH